MLGFLNKVTTPGTRACTSMQWNTAIVNPAIVNMIITSTITNIALQHPNIQIQCTCMSLFTTTKDHYIDHLLWIPW